MFNQDLTTKFINYIENQNLFTKKDKLLLAVSGGIDSVLMAQLLQSNGYLISIAHCNFCLRDQESDGDSKFVEDLAKKMGVPFFITKFDTKKVAKDNSISIQMAARELRYTWLEDIRQQNNLDYILLAHHQNDEIETFLINSIRGTGINGLHGILPKRNKLIRPLLFLTKQEIDNISRDYKIEYREDSSNKSNKYIRNKLRNEVIPILREINPQLEHCFNTTINNILKTADLFNFLIEQERNNILEVKQNHWIIQKNKITNKLYNVNLLYEILKPFGFNISTVYDIIKHSKSNNSGYSFLSDNYKIISHRDVFILYKNNTPCNNQNFDDIFSLTIQDVDNSYKRNNDQLKGYFDYDKITMPLIVRKWEKGDKITPLGMKKQKKISDILIDKKISLFEKEKTLVVISNNEIMWLVGQQISDNFKISEKTKKMALITYCNDIFTTAL